MKIREALILVLKNIHKSQGGHQTFIVSVVVIGVVIAEDVIKMTIKEGRENIIVKCQDHMRVKRMK